MKLYLISGEPKEQYDVCDGFVVAARSERIARGLCVMQAGDEGGNFWLDEKKSTCVVIGVAPNTTKEDIILRSFNAG